MDQDLRIAELARFNVHGIVQEMYRVYMTSAYRAVGEEVLPSRDDYTGRTPNAQTIRKLNECSVLWSRSLDQKFMSVERRNSRFNRQMARSQTVSKDRRP